MGPTYEEQIRLQGPHKAPRRLAEIFKEEQRSLHPCASMPEGPAAPSVLSAIDLTSEPIMWLKMTG